MSLARNPDESDDDAERRRFLEDVLTGLGAPRKRLPAKYFYDDRGLSLFKSITETPEYYLTRSELAIMRGSAAEIASALGERCLLIEYGSGGGRKAGLLLNAMVEPAGYVSIDISREHLEAATEGLRRDFPTVPVIGVPVDFTSEFDLPRLPESRRRVVYFAGSTIGNFEPDDAAALLSSMQRHLVAGDGLLIGIDLKKDPDRLESAYNDSQRLTEAFNHNLLLRINAELEGDFEIDAFEHLAFYNPDRARIEMHLVSRAAQTVRVDGTQFHFDRGESIHTESSHKYDPDEFAAFAAPLGLRHRQRWLDEERNFGVLLFEVSGTGSEPAQPQSPRLS